MRKIYLLGLTLIFGFFLTGQSLFAEDTDLTSLILNNSFDLAPDPIDCSQPVDVASLAENNAWRPTFTNSPCNQFYGWTWDMGFVDEDGNQIMKNNSQGINKDATTKDGEWIAWIGGNLILPNELHEFYQVIDKDDLEAGTYKVQCLLSSKITKRTSQRLFANQNVQYFGVESDYENNQTEGETAAFAGYPKTEAEGDYDGNLREMVVYTTIGENDSLKIGIRTGNKKGDGTTAASSSPFWGWIKTDYFRLTKIDPVKAADASLATLTLSVGEINFSPETFTYNITLPEGTKSVTPAATGNVQDVTITGLGEVNVESGSGTSTIIVTALNGTSQQTYTINYTAPAGSGIGENSAAKASYFVDNGKLTVSGVESYTVYTINGVKIAHIRANALNTTIDLIPGVYVVDTKAEVFKVVVK